MVSDWTRHAPERVGRLGWSGDRPGVPDGAAWSGLLFEAADFFGHGFDVVIGQAGDWLHCQFAIFGDAFFDGFADCGVGQFGLNFGVGVIADFELFAHGSLAFAIGPVAHGTGLGKDGTAIGGIGIESWCKQYG